MITCNHVEKLKSKNESEKASAVKVLRDAAAYNGMRFIVFLKNLDSFKRLVVKNQEWMEILKNCIVEDNGVALRNLALKVYDNILHLEDVQDEVIRMKHHLWLVSLLDSQSLYVKKTSASIVTHLLSQKKHQREMISLGALKVALVEPRLSTLETRLLLQEIGDSIPLSKENQHLLSPFLANRTYRPVLNILYLHTVFGGGLWGLISSLYHKTSIVSNVSRTAFITGLIPAIFMGGLVGFFQNNQKQTDKESDVYFLYAGTLFAVMYPSWYLLPIVESFAPLWVGGHILGFMSYFTYLVYSESDLMRSDAILEQKDEMKRQSALRKKRREEILEAKLLAEIIEKENAEKGAK